MLSSINKLNFLTTQNGTDLLRQSMKGWQWKKKTERIRKCLTQWKVGIQIRTMLKDKTQMPIIQEKLLLMVQQGDRTPIINNNKTKSMAVDLEFNGLISQ